MANAVRMKTRLGASLVLAALLPCSVHAVVNPELFRQDLIDRAPEWLTIDVVAVDRNEPSAGVIQVAAAAMVREVARTSTELKSGMPILIIYTLDVAAEERAVAEMTERAKRGWAGMQREGLPTVVEAGKTYHAHLIPVTGSLTGGRVYMPAAASYTFEVVSTED
jgi:hypothetical protein